MAEDDLELLTSDPCFPSSGMTGMDTKPGFM